MFKLLSKIIKVALILVLVALFGSSGYVYAAQNAPVSGEIEHIFINDSNDHWSGGEIVVGGQIVIIPRNLLIDLPANRVTLKQLFDEAPAECLAAGETGLAKNDTCNASRTGGFASIAANLSNNGNIIAGDVLIEKGREVVTGNITYINYADGYFRLDGIPNDPNTGVMVRLNDPDGRHTVQQGLGCAAGAPNCSPDPRFTLDPDNYTNVYSTGYPLCIPSTVSRTFDDVLGLGTTTAQALADGTGDVLCPSTNRTINGGQPVDDSRRFAPIMLGDNITAEGNFETINGVHFISAHTTMVGSVALSTKNLATQPDYLFLDEVEVDAPGFQNERIRTLIIGYATKTPTDVLIWALHYDPDTNEAHEFPLATVQGCDTAAGAGTCGAQGLVGAGANIFKIRHDVDFIAGADPKLNPCAHLQADPRMGNGLCPNGGASDLATPAVLGDQAAILSPIMHEIQARSGHGLANSGLTTLDINGNVATNGQYLFPFGMNLGGVSTPEFNEINLDALNTPFSFSGIPWLLDRRLSPAGCIDTDGNGTVDCEATPQPLDPFPYEGIDPRTLSSIPQGAYNDPNFTNSPLTRLSDRIFSYVTNVGGNTFNFDGDNTRLTWPPVDPAAIEIRPTPPLSSVNAPPQITSSPLITATAGEPYSYQVVASDANPGDTLTYSLDDSPVGMAINSATGLIEWTPGLAQSGTQTVGVRVTDAGGLFVTQTFTITVGANAAPVANNDLATTDAGLAVNVNVIANDTDSDGTVDAASIIIVGAPANGTTEVFANGTVTYTPNAGFSGSNTFTYTINDNLGATSNIAAVTVTVNALPGPNTPPVANNDTVNTAFNSAVVINVIANDTDVDGNATIDTASVAVVNAPGNGTAVSNGNGSVTYTPTAGFSGGDSFTYTIRDNASALSNTATVNITVAAAPAETLTVSTALFRILGARWIISGTDSIPASVITISLEGGGVIGTGNVSALGIWSFTTRNSAIIPQAGDRLRVDSSNGAVLRNVPITIRN